MHTYLPPFRNHQGWLTVEANVLSRTYDALNSEETKKRDAHFAANRLTQTEEQLTEPFARWLDTYEREPATAIATTNWRGKVTRALFAALLLKQPRSKTEMLAVLSAPDRHAAFNHWPHLAVDVPDGGFTITARTQGGQRITFAFVPYQNGGPPGCVDVKFHDSGLTIPNGDDRVSVMHAIGFTCGHDTFDTRKVKDPTTLLTVLLDPKHYPPLDVK